MAFKNKTFAILLIVSGLMVAVGNAYLFWEHRTPWEAFMFFAGVGWIIIGVSQLRRLQKAGSE